MPDISLCRNQDCTRRLTCYRFLAEPNPENQAYVDFKQVNGYCEHYWPHRFFPIAADPIETLRWIHLKRRDGDAGAIATMSGLNRGTISLYLTHAGKAVLKPLIVDKIIKSFKKIYDERI